MSLKSEFVFIIFVIFFVNSSLEVSSKVVSGITPLIEGGSHRPDNAIGKHIVSIRMSTDFGFYGINHVCGGAIISLRVVLTSAHCVQDVTGQVKAIEDVLVVAGSIRRLSVMSYTKFYTIDRIVIHPEFEVRINSGDIALLYLEGTIEANNPHIGAISLADKEPVPKQKCTTYGWGAILPGGPSPDELLYIDIEIYPARNCAITNLFSKGQICAGSGDKDATQGDSGGPLICDGKLYGTVSYGIVGLPIGFYTDVWYYRDWILKNGMKVQSGSDAICCLVVALIMEIAIV